MTPRPPRSTLFPYRRSSDLPRVDGPEEGEGVADLEPVLVGDVLPDDAGRALLLEGVPLRGREQVDRRLGVGVPRSEEHTSELQSQSNLVCRLLLEKKKQLTQ